MKKYMFSLILGVCFLTASSLLSADRDPKIGLSALMLNGNGYGEITTLWDKWDVGILFRSQSYEKANGTANTNLVEFGLRGGLKYTLSDTQTFNYGLIWTLLSGKKDGSDLTGGTAFAPYLGVSQKFGRSFLAFVNYIPFYSINYASNSGDIKEFHLSVLSAGFTYLF